MTGIYKITNSNNEVYIGATIDFIRRQREHKSRKHGHKGNMELIIELPMDVSKEVLNNYEEFCHTQFKEAGVILLNQTKPGNIQHHSEQTKEKMRYMKLGKSQSDEHKKHIKEAKEKPISAFDMQNNFIKDFLSIQSAAELLNLHASGISNCLLGNQTSTKGFIFKYKTKECTYP